MTIYLSILRPPPKTAADQLFDNLTGTAKDIVTDAINKGK